MNKEFIHGSCRRFHSKKLTGLHELVHRRPFTERGAKALTNIDFYHGQGFIHISKLLKFCQISFIKFIFFINTDHHTLMPPCVVYAAGLNPNQILEEANLWMETARSKGEMLRFFSFPPRFVRVWVRYPLLPRPGPTKLCRCRFTHNAYQVNVVFVVKVGLGRGRGITIITYNLWCELP